MKKWLKVICLILVLACILPAVVACDNNGEKTSEKTSEKATEKPTSGESNTGGEEPTGDETPTENTQKPATPPSIDSSATYGGANFTILSVEDMFAKKYFFADKRTGDGMNDSLYERQMAVKDLLDVNLVYVAAQGQGAEAAYQRYATDVINAIKVKEDKYQLVLSHSYYALPKLITEGALYNFKDFKYVDTGADYWNSGIMDTLAYKGSYYLGYSDFNLAQTYVVAFNKTLYNNYSSAFNGKTMYDYVNENNWTLATMTDAAEQVSSDNGDVTTNVYGLTGEIWVPFCGFLQSSGIQIVSRNANTGKYSISWSNDSTIKRLASNVVTKLAKLNQAEYTYFWKHPAFTNNVEPTKVELSSGRAFMQLMSTNQLITLKDTSVKFGVLPYPMYDAKQANTVGYQSLNWAGYLCIPSIIKNPDMVGAVVESLSFYSADVTEYYYEKLLGLKVSEAPEDAKMLEIIWDSLCSDFGVAYSMLDDSGNMDALVYAVPRCIFEGNSFTGWHSKYGVPANNALIEKLNK